MGDTGGINARITIGPHVECHLGEGKTKDEEAKYLLKVSLIPGG